MSDIENPLAPILGARPRHDPANDTNGMLVGFDQVFDLISTPVQNDSLSARTMEVNLSHVSLP
jgi:hypothetical protein